MEKAILPWERDCFERLPKRENHKSFSLDFKHCRVLINAKNTGFVQHGGG